MTKFKKILILGVVAIIVVAMAIVFAVERKDAEIEKRLLEMKKDALIEAQKQPRKITIYEDRPTKELDIQEVKDVISSTSLNESKIQEWKSYTSENFGISFKYPPDYLIVETEEIRIFEDTPDNRHVEKIMNLDFDYVIPEDQKNPDFEPWSQVVTLSKSIDGGFTQDAVEWYKENEFGENGNPHAYTPVQFMGIKSVASREEGFFTIDSVFFEREGILYQFGVQYFNSSESPRDNFYKIISIIEFQ